MNQKLVKIKDFLLKYETKIALIVGFCLVSAVSYEFGVLQGQKNSRAKIYKEVLIDFDP
jgi:hypothetical protein